MLNSKKIKEYLIIGGGHQGLTMAAHFSLNGEKVNLWNRTLGNIQTVYETKKIHCAGEIEGTATVNMVSTDIDDVWTDIIMVTTPAIAHKDIARIIAHKVTDNTIIILNPGRTLGAMEFKEQLKKSGCIHNPKIAETQTIVYTCRRDLSNGVTIFALKKDVMIAALDNDHTNEVMEAIPECIRSNFQIEDSIIKTSFGNIGMILHCAPVLMNIGWIESQVAEFEYYYDGISKSVARFLEKMDLERLNVAKALGYELESTRDWLIRSYNVKGDGLYDCISNNMHYKGIFAPKSTNHRYIEEDIPCGLVPLEYVAKQKGIETPLTTLIIDMANAIMEKDFRKIGRRYEI